MAADPLTYADTSNEWDLNRNSVSLMHFKVTGEISLRAPVAVKTTTYAVALSDAGGVLTSLTDNQDFTLPACAAAYNGFRITFVNKAATGAALITVTPSGTDRISGSIASVAIDDTGTKKIRNTKATQVKGDYATLVCDGTQWWIVGGVGVWAIS